jgi:CRISPR-associated protein Csa2
VISPTTYATYFVPAVSGESIAHGFQEILANRADKDGLPVCNFCKRGIFLKSTTSEIIKEAFSIEAEKVKIQSYERKQKHSGTSNENTPEIQWLKSIINENITEDNIHEALEKAVISRCTVEDVGGFMYAEKTFGGVNVGSFRRTSCFSVGYMIPAREAIESAVIEPQLHTRFVQGMSYSTQKEYQQPYYVELSSAPYVFSFDLDTKYIGKLTFSYKKAGSLAIKDDERKKRICISLDSLKHLLTEIMFGAKKTRFLPIIDWESIVIALSSGTWTTTSPLTANYIVNTLSKYNRVKNETDLFIYVNPVLFEDTTIYVKKRTEELLESFYSSLDEFKKRLEERGDSNLLDWNEFKKRKLEEFLERKVDELVESRDLKYISAVQREYSKAKDKLKKMNIELYENFEECVSDAIEKAKGRVECQQQ